MTIAQRLQEIAKAESKETLKEKFEKDFKDHKEWKILEESLKAACAGRFFISFGRGYLDI